MPHVTVPPARRHAEQQALERIRGLSRAGLDVAGFLTEVNPVVNRVVRNGTETITSPYWYTLDPQSHLVTSIYGHGCDQVDPGAYMRWDLLADDFIKTADVVAAETGVLTLHEATDGVPERSRIYREVMVPHGMAQELMVALRSPGGETWGTARMNRLPGEPMFSPDEISFMAAAAPLVAEGVRRGLLVGEAAEPDRPDAPGLVTMTAEGEVAWLSPYAGAWFARLPQDDGRQDGVPTSVLAVAAGAVRDARRGGRSGGLATARVPTTDGTWALVHGSVTGSSTRASVTVVIETAHPDRITPLLMSIYELTRREQQVTRRVLQGGSTTEVASQLAMSPHTVQQHLKHIFEKAEVNSRRELVAKVYFDCFDPRTRDNQQRIQAEKAIRGGPKTHAADRLRA